MKVLYVGGPNARPLHLVLPSNHLGAFMATKKSNENTSAAVASKAGKILTNPKSTAAQKSVAASALTQAKNKGKK